MSQIGRPPSEPTHRPTPKTDPKAVAKWIGRQYVESESLPREDDLIGIYGSLSCKINRLFEDMDVYVKFQEEDPYSDYQDMRETVDNEGMLRIYSGHADEHKYFSEETNLRFRAVHDWCGHLRYDVDFTPQGEYLKWFNMIHNGDVSYTWDESRVLFAEVVGQVGEVHYLRDGFEDPRYTQRAFVAPKEWIDMMSNAVTEGGR